MRETQAEIKAIEAQLRSIRVDSNPPQRVSTTLEPSSTHSRTRSTSTLDALPQMHQGGNLSPSTHRAAQHASQTNFSQTKISQTKQSSQTKPSQTKSSQTKQVESYPLPPKYRPPSQLEATVDRLQAQSALYVQQFRQLQSQAFQTPEQLFEQTLKILDSQVQHINQLSAVQESAILELKTIAEQVEREWKTIEQSQRDDRDPIEAALDSSPICEYVGTAVPLIEKNRDGVYVLSARSIDLFRAEREANLTAEALRQRSTRRSNIQPELVSPSIWQRLGHLLSPAGATRSAGSTRSNVRSMAQTAIAAPDPSAQSSHRVARSRRQRSVLRLKEAVALFLGAVIIRIVLDMVLVAFPVFWTPAIALLVTPAAIAVYRGSHTPHSGLIWGYRLLIIMIGLLLGARL